MGKTNPLNDDDLGQRPCAMAVPMPGNRILVIARRTFVALPRQGDELCGKVGDGVKKAA